MKSRKTIQSTTLEDKEWFTSGFVGGNKAFLSLCSCLLLLSFAKEYSKLDVNQLRP
jgi:hypothetical protein